MIPVPIDYLFIAHVPNRSQPMTAMTNFFAGCAHGLVEAQQALDEAGRKSLVDWEENGIPPTILMWSQCQFRFPVTISVDTTDESAVQIRPRHQPLGSVSLSFRYIPTPQLDEPGR
jgi:hypothetical protein